mmetsp:Transcript_46092/g.122177  ORF Transcript_46092/g.122177 Transcript_46092/m.122177 type:complete len:93 (+) Transcript_46092:97-375(+)
MSKPPSRGSWRAVHTWPNAEITRARDIHKNTSQDVAPTTCVSKKREPMVETIHIEWCPWRFVWTFEPARTAANAVHAKTPKVLRTTSGQKFR